MFHLSYSWSFEKSTSSTKCDLCFDPGMLGCLITEYIFLNCADLELFCFDQIDEKTVLGKSFLKDVTDEKKGGKQWILVSDCGD